MGDDPADSTSRIAAYWPPTVYTDYAAAVVRLATVAHERVSHLLFAVVELYPREVPVPPLGHSESRNIGPLRLIYSLTPMPLEDALAWYERSASGRLTVPGTEIVVSASRLGPEPMFGRFVTGDQAPFAPAWHAGPRLHRLVPLDEPAPVVASLMAGPHPDERQKLARSWLAERLHFDVLAHDDWLGGCALLAANPVVRAFRPVLSSSPSNGPETVQVSAPRRKGMESCPLSIRFREVRFDGSTNVQRVELDRFGRAHAPSPEPVQDIVVELECEQRGLLAIEGPHGFVRRFVGTIDVEAGGALVEVPSPKAKGRPTSYRRAARTSESFEVSGPPMSGTDQRLVTLRERRRLRAGEAGPGAVWSRGRDEELVFDGDREAAAATVRTIVAAARKEVVFVDPFFDHVALRDFALATSYGDVNVEVLLSRDHLRNAIDPADAASQTIGQVLLDDLKELSRRSREHRIPLPELRLMGGDARKYHDRFLVKDDEVWHCGHSFNQVGRGEVSMMTRLHHPDELHDAIAADFAVALPLAAWILEMEASKESGDVLIGDAAPERERHSLWLIVWRWFRRIVRQTTALPSNDKR